MPKFIKKTYIYDADFVNKYTFYDAKNCILIFTKKIKMQLKRKIDFLPKTMPYGCERQLFRLMENK